MLSSFLNVFKTEMKKPEEKPEEEMKKSSSAEEFVKTPEAKEFVEKWAGKKDKEGRRLYTKRGITDLITTIYQVPGLDTNKKILDAAERILTKLRGMDGLQGFLAGWKAKSEGLMKGIASILKKAA